MYKNYILLNNIKGDIMIKDIMSKKIIFSNIDSSIKDVSKLMKKNNIGFIPIKDNNQYVGVVTDRDICLSLPTLKSINDSMLYTLFAQFFFLIYILMQTFFT